MNATPLRTLFSGRFIYLFLSIVLLFVLYPILEPHDIAGVAAIEVFYWAVLLSAIRAVTRDKPGVKTVAFLLVGVNLLYRVLRLLSPAAAFEWIELITEIVLYAFMALVILGYVFRSGRVDADRIFGAICVYFFIGLIWGDIYWLIERFRPGSFLPEGTSDLASFLYYSYTTLTTLGYGDITAATSLTRMLSTLEAMIGQIYLTVLVARLVGLHIAHGKEDAE